MIRYLRKYLHTDTVLASILLLVGITSIVVSEHFNLSRSHLGAAGILASISYMLFPKIISANWQSIRPRNGRRGFTSSKYFISCTVLWFIFLLLSASILRREIYHRPPLYFVFIFVSITFLIIQILFVELNTPTRHLITLGQILVVVISLKSSAFFLYPSVSGNDPFFHERIVEYTISRGSIPQTIYSSFPMMHLLASVFSILTQSDPRFGLYYVSLLHSVLLLSVYSISRLVYDSKTGYLAAVLAGIVDYQIIWGIQVIPMTFGIALFSLILFCLLKRNHAENAKDRIRWTLCILILSSTMVLAHTLTTLILIFAVMVVQVSNFVSDLVNKNPQESSNLSVSLIIFLVISTLVYWMYALVNYEQDFFTTAIKAAETALAMAELGNVNMVSISGMLNRWSVFAGEGGWTMMLLPALIGVLASFNRKFATQDRRALAILSVFLLAVTYGGASIGAASILPARWITFASIPASILASYVFISALTAGQLKMTKTIALIFLMLTYGMLLTSPTRAIPDSPIYLSELSIRPGFYESEITGIKYAQMEIGGTLAASHKSRLLLPEAMGIDPRIPTTYTSSSAIVTRSFDMERGYFIPFPKQQILEYTIPAEDFIEYLNGPSRIKVYDNGQVNIYLSSALFK